MKTRSLLRFAIGVALILAMSFLPIQTLANSHLSALEFVVTNLNDSGPGSLRQAVLTANSVGGANVLTVTVSGIINLSSTLPVVSDALVIDGGSNDITVSGSGQVRILEIQPGVPVRLINLTFADGVFDYGGGIYNQGNLRIENCRFRQNNADTGAAIYNASELIIFGSLFEENTARTGGGGIWNRPEGYLEIHQSTLRENAVEYDFGGAVYNLGEAVIDASEIRGNYAINVGGGIINWGSLELTNSQVMENHAKLGGGVDNTLHGTVVIRNTTISGNGAWHWGGGINNDGEMAVYSSQVTDNRGTEFAGGIYNSGGLQLVDTQVSNNHGYSSNTSPEFMVGGGIYNQSHLTLSNSHVEGNSALQGGGIYNSRNGNLILSDHSQVSGNTSGENGGGGIYNFGTVSASQCVFDQNTANAPYGGGIFNESSGAVELSDCQVTGNRAWNSGGGVYNLGEFSMLRSRLATNLAYDMGGGIFSLGRSTISESTVDDNTSWNYAGGIYSSGELAISASTISNNTSWTGGGMLIGRTASVVNSTLSGNYASGYGGGIKNYGQLEIRYSTIAANTVEAGTGYGGGIDNEGDLSIGFSIVANNTELDNCHGDFILTGTNLSDDATCTGFTVADPRLGPLQDNGGPTLTHALLTGSPAVDAANDPACPATDQRGRPRPQGASCDLGAYEASPATLLIDINPKTPTNGIDLTSNAAIPVAILSAPNFNAARQIIQTSLTFGMTGLEDSLLRLPPLSTPVCSAADMNGDGLPDLVCHFKIKAAGFTCQAERGILIARLLDGSQAMGSDSVKILRCP